jgi:hypothetical protein
MAVGKRTSTDQPLTEHDVAERLDAAALRVWRILSDARQLGIMGPVRSSRYWHGAVNHMLGELEAWNVEPWHLPEAPVEPDVPDVPETTTATAAAIEAGS